MTIPKSLAAAILTSATLLTSAVEVINAGRPGWNTVQLREIFAAELEKHRPDLVILMAGTNDNLNSYNLTPLDTYAENLTAMVKAAKEAGANVILAEIPNACQQLMIKRHKPGFFDKESAPEKVGKANAAVAAVAKQTGATLLPTTQILGPATLEASSLYRNIANSGAEDGVHLVPAGYAKFAEAAAMTIRKAGWTPKKILCFGDSLTAGVSVKGTGTADPESETYPGQLAKQLAQP